MKGVESLARALERQGYAERLRRDEALAPYTTFGIGGPADLLVEAWSGDELCELLALARRAEVPVVVLGGGSNVLVADAGVRGLVIVNRCEAFAIDDGGQVVSESGRKLADLANWAVEAGWAGLEWAVGVPGTLGGAVVGNAGAYGGAMADAVVWVEVVRPEGELVRLSVAEMEYGYRTSVLKREAREGYRSVVLTAALQLQRGDAEALAERARSVTALRQARTPADVRCAGSIFKRTLQYPAGFLIEQAGLKGRRIGGAMVSPLHANFLVNAGGATAADMLALVRLVQREVWSAFAQRLEPEIELLGEWPDGEAAE